jgi:transcriptional regulator with XRE-family HTH domain
VTETTETIGQRLKRLRIERNLTQRQVAFPGCTAVYICRIEKGQRDPSLTVIRGLAERLGVSAELLETGKETPQPPYESIRAVVEYDWQTELADYEVEGEPEGHVFEHLRAVREWLDGVPTNGRGLSVVCSSDGVNPAEWEIPAGVTVAFNGPDYESTFTLEGPHEGPLPEMQVCPDCLDTVPASDGRCACGQTLDARDTASATDGRRSAEGH